MHACMGVLACVHVCVPVYMCVVEHSVCCAAADLYNNHNGMADDMVQFWAKSASYFSNNSNVIGYELINEPWAGDVFAVRVG